MSAADSAAPRLRLLGPVQAWRGDTELDLGSAHRRTVLAALAMNPNRTVSREELIDAVWGEAPPQSAQGSIYTYVSGLRRSLEPGRAKGAKGEGPQLLASIGSGYSLCLDAEAIDVHHFEALREQAQRRRVRRMTCAARAKPSTRPWASGTASRCPGCPGRSRPPSAPGSARCGWRRSNAAPRSCWSPAGTTSSSPS